MAKLIYLEQGSAEWLAFRDSKIGASDAPILMGVSPWKTPYQLWQEKNHLVPPQVETFAMTSGKAREGAALAAVSERLGETLVPAVFQDETREWMIASMDGVTIDGQLAVEIKHASRENHLCAVEGRVPEKYMPQLQHQMHVLGLEKIWYYSVPFSESNGDPVLMEVARDQVMIDELLKREDEFIACMENFQPPVETSRDVSVMDENRVWQKTALELRDLRLKKSDLQKQVEELDILEKTMQKLLIEATGGRSGVGCGLRLTRIFTRGAIEYKAIPEVKEIPEDELEKYRKPPRDSWRLTVDLKSVA